MSGMAPATGQRAPDYSREFCQPQYDTFRTAPDAAAVMRLRTELSERALGDLRPAIDVAYGRRAKQKLDVFAARGPSRGVMIYFHGGFWQRMDKRDVSFLARPFVEAGMTFLNVNYTLAPAASLDEIVAEAREACRWAWQMAGQHGGNRENIQVSGSSAGGHLALMMAATDWPAWDASLPADLLKGACGVSGLYELEPLLFTAVNDALGLDLQAARRNSPARLQPALAGPLLLAVGGLESPEFQRQTRELAQGWSSLPVQVMTIPGRHHFDILLDLGSPESGLATALLRQMERTAPASN